MSRHHPILLRTLVALALSGAAVLSSADPQDLDLDVKPVWLGTAVSTGVCPLRVILGNKGPDAKGVVRVSCEGFSMDYPVELPRDSKKELIVYPELAQMGAGQVEVVLGTNQGSSRLLFSPPSIVGPDGTIVVLVSDHPGDLQFLGIKPPVTRRNEQLMTVKDAYATPRTLPDRTIAYGGIGAVMLGDGSERLTDGEVSSLKAYVLLGGTLVFKGGASAPILLDPRWASLLPVRNLKTTTLSAASILSGNEEPPEGQITIQDGDLVPGATAMRRAGHIVTAERVFGFGKAVFLAYDPFESPCNKWGGRRSAFLASVKPWEVQTASMYLTQYEMEPNQQTYYGGYYPPEQYNAESGPFNIQLPSTQRVFGILAAYFLVVIPINFLILRKLRKGEWAWVTSPLISVAFAAVFFGAAHDLYSAGLSTATKGIMIAGEGVPESVFVGNTKIFFPQGGSYDLKLTGIERIGTKKNPVDWTGSRSQDDFGEVSAVDNGEVHVSGLDVTNLSFRQLYYRQRLNGQRWLDIRPLGSGKVEIRNSSPYPMTSIRLCASGGETPVGDLRPGQAKATRFPDPVEADGNYNDMRSLKRLTVGRSGCVVIASVQDVTPGPQIGKNAEGQSQVNLAYFSTVSGGKR